MKKAFLYSVLGFFLLGVLDSCDSSNALEKEIAEIEIDLQYDRFDKKFFNADRNEFYALKAEYPYLFPPQYPDSIWLKRQRDSIQVVLQKEIDRVFPTLDGVTKELKPLLQHIRYYFPETSDPKIITVTNNVDYQNKTVYADSLILLSLDTFLGAKNELYKGIPAYIVRDMELPYLSAHLADEFAISVTPTPKDRTLLGQMIYYGKKLYLKDRLLPQTSDAIKISYTEEEIDWVKDNERYMWQYFIENELLYKTQANYALRFIEPAPFSKFYLEIDNESPGKVGQWLGWQIVRAYAEKNPEVTLQELLQLPAQTLFNQSKYKPAK